MIGQFREPNSSHSRVTRLPMRGGDHGPQIRPQASGLIQPLPIWVWIIAFSGALWGGMSLYPMLTAACCLSLPIVASLLFIKGESPILFACCAMQWLQVVVLVFYADVYNTSLERVLENPELEKAAWLSLAGIIAMAVGMRTALDSIGRGTVMAARMENSLEKLSLGRLKIAWMVAFFIASFVGAIAWKFGALRQFATPIGTIKWVFFYLLAYRVLVRDEGYRFLLSAVMIEFVSGFTGYFGGFKEGIMMLIIVVMGLPRGMNLRIRGLSLAFITLGFFASLFWSVVKGDYRAYLTQQWRQKGGASTMDKLEVIKLLVSRMDAKKMEEGFKTTVARVSYIGLFGNTLSHVPAVEPHSNGELWLGAVTHVLTPRFLFPDKKVLDDSARARRFTGMRLAGMEEGTSIGIGYMAESYADFGNLGMFFPIYLLGLFMGGIYRVCSRNKHSTLLGVSIGTAILFANVQSFEKSNVKIVGSMVTICLAYWALNFFFGAGLMRWLKKE